MKIKIQGLLQKFPDKPKIANTSGDISQIFWEFNPTPIMDVVSKFHDIRMYRSLLFAPDVTVQWSHRSKVATIIFFSVEEQKNIIAVSDSSIAMSPPSRLRIC